MNLFCSLILPFLAFFSSAGNDQLFKIDGPVTWIGIDYTHAKFVGAAGFTDPSDLPRFLLDWNDFVITEPDKYDVKKALGISDVTIDLSYTYKKNEGLDTEAMVQEEDHMITQEEAETVALSYDLSEIEGTAALLVAECYNKKTTKGSHWLILIDAQTSEIISAEHFVEKPGGFGLRNYWARTIYELLVSKEKATKKGK
ncbi:hypothetical protein SYJ56_21070 [Algoriphagus sp. D3-2-R+10]|uniref:hypothetical protein n=1 Tax=Algoriphagus aurantiacus TaxID=3103948 RepID=UPI002B37E939|nr:hypothetical protein [Algoriphagus sp. D3-2-R+10]MEB2777820.1 hypothetical protein [Algoriphagus sp. D3-2-R+10]